MKKRILSIMLTMVMILSIVPIGSFTMSASASTLANDDFIYEILNDGSVGIIGYKGSSKKLHFPSKIKGRSVTLINKWVIGGRPDITEITIPDTVTSIEDSFYGTAFYENPDNWDNGILYIGKHLIAAKDSVSSCKIKAGTKTIAAMAFAFSENLTKVVIPDSVTSIGYEAFSDCVKLKSINIPNGVTTIDSMAFAYCENLKSIKLPDSLTSIRSLAFHYTAYYNNPSNWTYDNALYIGKHLIEADKYATEYIVRDGTKCIAEDAFSDGSITMIGLPDSVTAISARAFWNCDSLEFVSLSNSLKTIGEGAFEGCENLTNISIPDSVTKIGNDAFSGCKNLKNIHVSDRNAKYSSKDGVLFNKRKTTIITYPAGKGNTSYKIPNGVSTIAPSAFYNSRNLNYISIPNSVTSIGDYAFGSCDKLKKVTLSKNLKTIAEGAFTFCEDLQTIAIPSSVQTIGYRSFDYCRNLKSITLGKGIKTIEKQAFARCSKLKNVYYSGSKSTKNKIDIVKKGNSYLKSAKWYYRKSLKAAKVTIKNQTYSGKSKTPSVTVRLNGKTLKNNVDYTVSFKNNKKIGKSIVTIKGINKYKNSAKATFKINPKKVTNLKLKTPAKKQLTVSWKKDSSVGGYEIVYATNSKFTKGKKTVKVTSAKKTIKKLKSKGTYYVKVRSYKKVGKATYYGAYTSAKKLKIK